MATGISANRLELLQIADAVAREKSIDKQVVIAAMEEAMERAAKSRFGAENEIKVEIDPKTGETHTSRYLHVVDEVDNTKTEISVVDARVRNPAAQAGDIIAETLPPIEFSRIATQAAKQVIVQKVRDAERERHYEEYKDRIGEIVHGTVKRVEFGSVVVDFGRAEGVVRRDEMIPRESFRTGDRIRAYIYDVRREARGPQIFLSRTHPQFMVRLFAQEVPEIYDGIIEIRAVARDPGSRAKIGVISKDSSIDPVGACVGMRGVRVQAVVQELQGERIDIIPWSPEPATFIVNALAPAEVSKIVLDEDTNRVEVVVPDDQLSLAIGRRGQNVRLGSQLTGWQIDILTEQEESERRQKEFADRTQLFVEALDVDETIAQLLASEGFANVEDVAYVAVHELSEIEGFDDETAEELQGRALGHIDEKNAALETKRVELGVDNELAELEALTPAMLVAIGENDIKNTEDLAGCVSDDLLGYVETKNNERVRVPGALEGFDVSVEEANALIMNARVKIGWVTAEDLLPPEEEKAEDGEAEDGKDDEAGAAVTDEASE
jgi:N utilization substance protein A